MQHRCICVFVEINAIIYGQVSIDLSLLSKNRKHQRSSSSYLACVTQWHPAQLHIKYTGVVTDKGQLSGGLSIAFSQYSFDPTDTVIRDAADSIAQQGRTCTFYPRATIGMFYTSNTDKHSPDGVFFCGLSYTQLIAGNILIEGNNQERQE